MMLNYEIEAKDMSFGPTAEEKGWAARKARMSAAIGASAVDVSNFENCTIPPSSRARCGGMRRR